MKRKLATVAVYGLGVAVGVVLALAGGNDLARVLGAAVGGFFAWPLFGALRALLVPAAPK